MGKVEGGYVGERIWPAHAAVSESAVGLELSVFTHLVLKRKRESKQERKKGEKRAWWDEG